MPQTEAEIIELGHGNTNMSPQQCLEMCQRHAKDYRQVIVLAIEHDDSFVHHSSGMSLPEANWLVDAAKQELMQRLFAKED